MGGGATRKRGRRKNALEMIRRRKRRKEARVLTKNDTIGSKVKVRSGVKRVRLGFKSLNLMGKSNV
ncbi:hypothetical protein PIB30_054093 [Stylosanthes scabra]|uniref:Uncharacterized protein n=1 Tax=Stylosanthes scabra TaxID=79078 RepID=A0ABU6QJG3_9FABA|nr:hypothetical protein [Stylosanthes scabra]